MTMHVHVIPSVKDYSVALCIRGRKVAFAVDTLGILEIFTSQFLHQHEDFLL